MPRPRASSKGCCRPEGRRYGQDFIGGYFSQGYNDAPLAEPAVKPAPLLALRFFVSREGRIPRAAVRLPREDLSPLRKAASAGDAYLPDHGKVDRQPGSGENHLWYGRTAAFAHARRVFQPRCRDIGVPAEDVAGSSPGRQAGGSRAARQASGGTPAGEASWSRAARQTGEGRAARKVAGSAARQTGGSRAARDAGFTPCAGSTRSAVARGLARLCAGRGAERVCPASIVRGEGALAGIPRLLCRGWTEGPHHFDARPSRSAESRPGDKGGARPAASSAAERRGERRRSDRNGSSAAGRAGHAIRCADAAGRGQRLAAGP